MTRRVPVLLIVLSAFGAGPATQPVSATSPATKPVAMKPISAAEEASYAATLETRAQAVLDDLKLTDAAKADHVKAAVIAQYRALRAWHDTYDDELKALNKNAAANAAALAAIKATLTTLHDSFLAKLSQDLTAAQVEVVKDRMTYGTVKVTYDEYLRQNPTLTDAQKAKILETLKEARELAMDDGSQAEKVATFGKYKGRINNLLAAWKKEAATAPATTSAPAGTRVGAAAPPATSEGVSSYPTFHVAKVLKAEMLYDKAPFPSCHASTLVETTDGHVVAAFFGGTAERNPDVCIWICRLVNGKWSAPEKVADGVQSDQSRLPTWNPVLFQPNAGPLMLFYKVGPSPQTWWGEFKTSTNNGKTWSKAERLPDGILGPIKDKPVQLDATTIVSGSSTENGGRHVHFEISHDNGVTWTKTPDIADAGFKPIQPTLLLHKTSEGVKLQALCRTQEDVLAESWSSDRGLTWSPMAASKLPNNDSGVDAVTLADGRHVLVYNPTLRADPVKGRTPLNVAVSKDGITWKDVLTLENSLSGQFSYPAVIQTRDGRVHITYTYKRETIKYVVLDPSSF